MIDHIRRLVESFFCSLIMLKHFFFHGGAFLMGLYIFIRPLHNALIRYLDVKLQAVSVLSHAESLMRTPLRRCQQHASEDSPANGFCDVCRECGPVP